MDEPSLKRPIPSRKKFHSYITMKEEEAMLRYKAQLKEARKNPALPMPKFVSPQAEMLRSALRLRETNFSPHKIKKVEIPAEELQVKKSES